MSLNDLFQTALFSGQLVEVGPFFSVQCVHFIKALKGTDHFCHRFFNRFANAVLHIELRFLRQIADLDARLRASFPFDIGIDAGHNAQQGRLTGTVKAQYANFGPREETQGNVFQNMTLRRNHFADAVHGIDVLSHVAPSLSISFYRLSGGLSVARFSTGSQIPYDDRQV
ncbi:hypothetical protein D3C79_456990 [compost metagenome]